MRLGAAAGDDKGRLPRAPEGDSSVRLAAPEPAPLSPAEFRPPLPNALAWAIRSRRKKDMIQATVARVQFGLIAGRPAGSHLEESVPPRRASTIAAFRSVPRTYCLVQYSAHPVPLSQGHALSGFEYRGFVTSLKRPSSERLGGSMTTLQVSVNPSS
jgi:hypothetical protein